MNPTHPTPQHASYRSHRRQVAWQIILPMVIAGLILLGVIYLISAATFQGNGEVDRWAAISTIWLVIPVIIGTLILLVTLVAIAYLLGRLAGLIPPYSYKAQLFASKIEAGAKRAAEVGRKPTLIVPELGGLIRRAFTLIRSGVNKARRKESS